MPNEHEGHRKRLKARFLKDGLDNFEPHNILELLLFFSVPRGDTNPIAHELINRFGSLSGVFDADFEDLVDVKGVGENSATLIKMIPDLTRKYYEDTSDKKNIVGSVNQLGAYVLPKFIGKTHEELLVISLDNNNKVISCATIAKGDPDGAKVSKRRVVEEAVKAKATKVALAHNHPRGIAVPSNEDKIFTERVGALLKEMGITLVDHIIVADNEFISFAKSGYISK